MKAIWKDVVIAESDATVIVEGNHYFPPAAIRAEHFHPSDTHTVCPWKGTTVLADVVLQLKSPYNDGTTHIGRFRWPVPAGL